MSLSGRYPEHDICENFNAIDVRELQRKNLLRPGLCFTNEWFRDGALSGKIFIMTQPDAIMLVYRARPPGATESRAAFCPNDRDSLLDNPSSLLRIVSPFLRKIQHAIDERMTVARQRRRQSGSS